LIVSTEATVETFGGLVESGNVLIDFWGPQCQPCLQLMPEIEALEDTHDGALNVVKVNATENRQVCRDLKVFGLPTYVLYRDGAEFARLSGSPTIDEIRGEVTRMLGGGEQ
jgi:thioredoxin 1